MRRAYTGKLSITVAEWKSPTIVIGTLSIENGPTYQLKMASPILLKQITPSDGKKCTLLGKLRNKGKYLIVLTTVDSGAKPVDRRKRGGM